MKVGIVGHEAAKFTPLGELHARRVIRGLLQPGDEVISGRCHLGGIDIWAVEEAKKLGLHGREFPPRTLNWTDGYKPRNIKIAEHSDRMVCLVVDKYPETYTGMRFDYCYHCHTKEHIKSGGCWTGKYAKAMGKQFEVIVIRNYDQLPEGAV